MYLLANLIIKLSTF